MFWLCYILPLYFVLFCFAHYTCFDKIWRVSDVMWIRNVLWNKNNELMLRWCCYCNCYYCYYIITIEIGQHCCSQPDQKIKNSSLSCNWYFNFCSSFHIYDVPEWNIWDAYDWINIKKQIIFGVTLCSCYANTRYPLEMQSYGALQHMCVCVTVFHESRTLVYTLIRYE